MKISEKRIRRIAKEQIIRKYYSNKINEQDDVEVDVEEEVKKKAPGFNNDQVVEFIKALAKSKVEGAAIAMNPADTVQAMTKNLQRGWRAFIKNAYEKQVTDETEKLIPGAVSPSDLYEKFPNFAQDIGYAGTFEGRMSFINNGGIPLKKSKTEIAVTKHNSKKLEGALRLAGNFVSGEMALNKGVIHIINEWYRSGWGVGMAGTGAKANNVIFNTLWALIEGDTGDLFGTRLLLAQYKMPDQPPYGDIDKKYIKGVNHSFVSALKHSSNLKDPKKYDVKEWIPQFRNDYPSPGNALVTMGTGFGGENPLVEKLYSLNRGRVASQYVDDETTENPKGKAMDHLAQSIRKLSEKKSWEIGPNAKQKLMSEVEAKIKPMQSWPGADDLWDDLTEPYYSGATGITSYRKKQSKERKGSIPHAAGETAGWVKNQAREWITGEDKKEIKESVSINRNKLREIFSEILREQNWEPWETLPGYEDPTTIEKVKDTVTDIAVGVKDAAKDAVYWTVDRLDDVGEWTEEAWKDNMPVALGGRPRSKDQADQAASRSKSSGKEELGKKHRYTVYEDVKFMQGIIDAPSAKGGPKGDGKWGPKTQESWVEWVGNRLKDDKWDGGRQDILIDWTGKGNDFASEISEETFDDHVKGARRFVEWLRDYDGEKDKDKKDQAPSKSKSIGTLPDSDDSEGDPSQDALKTKSKVKTRAGRYVLKTKTGGVEGGELVINLKGRMQGRIKDILGKKWGRFKITNLSRGALRDSGMSKKEFDNANLTAHKGLELGRGTVIENGDQKDKIWDALIGRNGVLTIG